MRYYYCKQLNHYYKIGNEGAKKRIYTFDSERATWIEIPIIKSGKGQGVYEYTLNIGVENSRVILREPDINTRADYLMLELSIGGNTQFLKLDPVPSELLKVAKPELLDEPAPVRTSPQHRQVSSHTKTFFSENNQYRKYDLSLGQRQALEAHRESLRNRLTEYHLLSYLFFCFSQGYSRTEKIEEITRLLETGEAKAEVVEQGHTGSIVLGMR